MANHVWTRLSAAVDASRGTAGRRALCRPGQDRPQGYRQAHPRSFFRAESTLAPRIRRSPTNKGLLPFAFADNYNGPGRWLQGLGFVESGGLVGKEGSLPGYESITMYSPSRQTTIVVASTKQAMPSRRRGCSRPSPRMSTAPASASGSRHAQALAPTAPASSRRVETRRQQPWSPGYPRFNQTTAALRLVDRCCPPFGWHRFA